MSSLDSFLSIVLRKLGWCMKKLLMVCLSIAFVSVYGAEDSADSAFKALIEKRGDIALTMIDFKKDVITAKFSGAGVCK